MNIYVAGGSTERMAVRDMIDRLVAEGIRVTHDWTRCEGYDRSSSDDERRAWAKQDLRGVHEADILWVMVPEQPSVGAAVEMGAALSGAGAVEKVYELCDRYDTHEDAFAAIVMLAEHCEDVE